MNKRIVEKMLPRALEGLNDPKCGICENGRIDKTFRGQISSFGASVTMGSFKSAIAFFGEKSSSTTERQNLIRLMYYIVNGEWKAAKDIVGIILCMKNDAELTEMQEKFLNASIAVKLAMNAFPLE